MDAPAASISEPKIPKYPLGAAAVAGYAVGMFLWSSLGWQHLGLMFFFWACLAPQEAPRRFIRDWWPMVFFWLSYDLMRVFASSLLPRVAVESPFRWELRLFLSPDGTIWPFYFARWTARHAGEFWPRVIEVYCNLVYLTQLFGLPSILLVLWVRRFDLLFRRLVWSLTALHVLTLVIYIGYPAAPPWWVYENGLAQPSVEHSMPEGQTQGTMLSTLFQVSPNRFAAIPSLHAAYPLLLIFVLALHGSTVRWIVLAGLYTASMWFACVFLNQHYIIDLLIGAALVPAALPVAALIGRKNTAGHI